MSRQMGLSYLTVALYTSAWIEIMELFIGGIMNAVALYTSAWIEINFRQAIRTSWPVALYTSAWIEIAAKQKRRAIRISRTLHECVD